MKRREFLHKTSHAAAVSSVLGALPFSAKSSRGLTALLSGAAETDHVLVLIFLNGGNDGLNTVVPVQYMSEMHAVRPHVVLPENQLLGLDGVDTLKLHPELTYYRSMYNEGKLKIIQNVGYPDQNYSHFRSTDIWMSASDSDETLNSGWAGRYLDFEYPGYPIDYPNPDVPHPLAVEIGYGSSLVFQGPANYMGMVIQNPEDYYNLLRNTNEPAPNTNAGEKLDYVRLIQRQSQVYGAAVQEVAERAPDQMGYPSGNELADQLKIVGQLIAGGLQTRLYVVSMGGFDTHDSQVESGDHTRGEHANLLRQLNEATEAFMEDLKRNGVADRVMGLTFSEFGRRIISNASLGTDHGAAAPVLAFGNAVEGGILGEDPYIDSGMTYSDNLPFEFDFRQVYASVLNQWLCVDRQDLTGILGQDFDLLDISPDSDCFISTSDRYITQNAGKPLLKVSPNPLNGRAFIEFESLGEQLTIDFLDGSGRLVDRITSRSFPAGKHSIDYGTSHLPQGHYICRLVSLKGGVQARSLVKR